MARKVNFKIGPEREYNKNEDVNILYICNDTNKAFIPDSNDTKDKDTGWLSCTPSSEAHPFCVAVARQVGYVVTVTGRFMKDSLRTGDLLFTVPFLIDQPKMAMELDFHQKSNAQENRGIRIKLEINGRIIISAEHALSDEEIYFNFTYLSKREQQ